jgi:hypothetical protein
VWTATHPTPGTVFWDNPISSYSRYGERKCRCQVVSSTSHTPPHAQQEAAPPCFIETDVQDQVTAGDLMQYFREQPCYEDDRIHGSFLHSKWGEGEQRRWVEDCLTPAREATAASHAAPTRTVFVVGDSHSAVLMPGLMTALDGVASVVWVAAGAGCGYLSDDVLTSTRGTRNYHGGVLIQPCMTHNHIVNDVFRRHLQACDIVIVHQHSYARNGWGGKLQGANVAAAQKEYYRELQALVQSRDARLVLIGDIGELPQRGPHCAQSEWLEEECEMDLHEVEQQVSLEKQIYSELAQASGTYYFPLHQLMCQNNRCGAFIPNSDTLLYGDSDHMTTEASLYLWPFLCAFFQDNGLLE